MRILQDGVIYSRAQAEARGKLAVSSGSPAVLAGTDKAVKEFVRLYFRPQTPTQYHAEGVHSSHSLAKSRYPKAHCPVPIFFLFDSPSILSRPDCWFSDRGLGGHDYHLGNSLEALRQLPWKRIYHNSWIDWGNPERAREIVACRNAEVIVAEKLELDALKFIYCRSEAEKDTLLHLLPSHLRQKYQRKIFASNRSPLFFRKRTFIENASLLGDRIHLRFSPDTTAPGPFHLHIEITTNKTFVTKIENFTLGPSYEYRILLRQYLGRYEIKALLDGHLVYANAFDDVNIPF